MYMRFVGGGVGHTPSAKDNHCTLNLNSNVESEQFADPLEAREPTFATPEEGEMKDDDAMDDDSGSESGSSENGAQQDVEMGGHSDGSDDTEESSDSENENSTDADNDSDDAVSAGAHEPDLSSSDFDDSSEVDEGSDIEGDL
jgi:hypothetical protein